MTCKRELLLKSRRLPEWRGRDASGAGHPVGRQAELTMSPAIHHVSSHVLWDSLFKEILFYQTHHHHQHSSKTVRTLQFCNAAATRLKVHWEFAPTSALEIHHRRGVLQWNLHMQAQEWIWASAPTTLLADNCKIPFQHFPTTYI